MKDKIYIKRFIKTEDDLPKKEGARKIKSKLMEE